MTKACPIKENKSLGNGIILQIFYTNERENNKISE